MATAGRAQRLGGRWRVLEGAVLDRRRLALGEPEELGQGVDCRRAIRRSPTGCGAARRRGRFGRGCRRESGAGEGCWPWLTAGPRRRNRLGRLRRRPRRLRGRGMTRRRYELHDVALAPWAPRAALPLTAVPIRRSNSKPTIVGDVRGVCRCVATRRRLCRGPGCATDVREGIGADFVAARLPAVARRFIGWRRCFRAHPRNRRQRGAAIRRRAGSVATVSADSAFRSVAGSAAPSSGAVRLRARDARPGAASARGDCGVVQRPRRSQCQARPVRCVRLVRSGRGRHGIVARHHPLSSQARALSVTVPGASGNIWCATAPPRAIANAVASAAYATPLRRDAGTRFVIASRDDEAERTVSRVAVSARPRAHRRLARAVCEPRGSAARAGSSA